MTKSEARTTLAAAAATAMGDPGAATLRAEDAIEGRGDTGCCTAAAAAGAGDAARGTPLAAAAAAATAEGVWAAVLPLLLGLPASPLPQRPGIADGAAVARTAPAIPFSSPLGSPSGVLGRCG